MDEDNDEEGEGIVGFRKTKHKIGDYQVYRDAVGNYVVIIDGEGITAFSLDALEYELSLRSPIVP